jgi:hypothetical protein
MVEKQQAISDLAHEFPQFGRSGGVLKNQDRAAETCFDIPALVRFLTEELYEKGDHERLHAVFHQIEKFLTDGTPEVRSVFGVSFVETLHSVAASKSYSGDTFSPFLGPETRRVWWERDAIWRASLSLDLEDRTILEGEVLVWRIVHRKVS